MPESTDVSAGDQGLATQYNNLRKDALKVWAQGSSELTIASGVVTLGTDGFYTVDTQADAASDDLDTISGGETGEIIILGANNTARTVVVKHGTGNIKLQGEADLPLVDTDQLIMVRYNGTDWVEVSGGADRTVVWGYTLGQTGSGSVPATAYGDIPYMPAVYLMGIYADANIAGTAYVDIQYGAVGASLGTADSIGTAVPAVTLAGTIAYVDTTLTGITRGYAAGKWRFAETTIAATIEQVTVVCVGVKV